MTSRRWVLPAAIAAGAMGLTVAIALVAVGVAPSAPEARPDPPAASTPPDVEASPAEVDAPALAADFIDAWVDDGRVVRRDQGDDTVSEGQAYGLLAAVTADDAEAFDEIWSWTAANLQRSDGLLAWRWADGAIVDPEPASDADLDAARALVLAGDRFDEPAYTEAGVTLAGVIADRLTATTSLGRILLPGLWAAGIDPYAYNPSYASPAAFEQLGAATGDARWGELQAGTAAVTAALLDATDLPPDWAQVHGDGLVEPMPGPAGTGAPVQYGYDAARLVLRYAESCAPADTALAALVYPTLRRTDDLPAQLDLGGGAMSEDRSPLAFAARAAAAGASGETSDGHRDLQRAAELSAELPTYYGRAWTALAAAMLTGDELGGCAVLPDGGAA